MENYGDYEENNQEIKEDEANVVKKEAKYAMIIAGIVILLIVVIGIWKFSPFGSADSNNKGTDQADFDSDDWTCNEVKIDRTIIQLPCGVGEWKSGEKIGYDDNLSQVSLAQGENLYVKFAAAENNTPHTAAGFIITNSTDKSIPASEGTVSQITVDSKMAAADKVSFPGDVAINKKIDQAIASWGEPASVQSEDKGDVYTWQKKTGETCIITADKETKQIVKIEMKAIK